jgi:hypothetical protein
MAVGKASPVKIESEPVALQEPSETITIQQGSEPNGVDASFSIKTAPLLTSPLEVSSLRTFYILG